MTDFNEIRIAAHHADQRLDRWLKKQRPDIPHALVQKLLRKGGIKVNGKRAKAEQRLEKGDVIRLPAVAVQATKAVTRPKTITPVQGEKILKSVIHLTPEMVILNKPAGLAVQGGSGVTMSVDIMAAYLREPWLTLSAQRQPLPSQESTVSHDPTPKLTHRIDKDTSGILMLARHDVAAREMTTAFKRKQFQKTYWALVVGVPSNLQGKIDLPMNAKKTLGSSQFEKASVDEDEGKPALTYYQVVETAGTKLAWVALQPVSGRMHQLRVHMAAIGHPILGDGKYGGKEAFIEGLSDKMHLHARRVIHPKIFGKKLDIHAPLPPHMQESWEMFEFDVNDKRDFFAELNAE